ncbi:purple acid phosphatase family protein [Streptomyces collinus]|uniref:Phosphoesterase n=1 Tax=Streptomyces collinus (strain DSM 40733 / Tue 365) TaxID=1214242 RepID=S5V3P4_STRC3|nr:metallophosphoesterase family protein [Streptomyces collinus]AGS69759.1 phosphoesterase [Streptomyces collinus Tu 365]UJA08400.1 metallophosphoesterase family protein [Streptomyces collinus]UJA16735.1 metallophosphoesterase family protein [Streptomyces collinus]
MGVPEKLAERMSMAEQHEYLRARFSRRTMIRGGAVTLGAVAGGAFVPGGTAQAAVPAQRHTPAAQKVDGALVAPFGRHLSYGTDPRTEMTVSWQVPVAVKKPFIRIGAHPWDLSRKIEAEVRSLYTPAGVGASGDHTQYYLHARLTHLRPGKTYYYGVGHEGFDPAERHLLGTLGTFTTAPAHKEPFTFTAFGDQGVSYHALANDSLILGQNPAFHLHAGDIAYGDPAGQGKATDTGFDSRTWDQFLHQTESVAKQIPWMVSFGNHDMEAWYSPNGYGGEEARWTLPDNGPDPKNLPGVYSFVHGNTAIISLDPNDVSFEIPANLGISGGTQTTWFEAQLKRFRAAKDIDFVIVFFHHCAYCTSTAHASEGGVRQEWVPLFEKYTVDLVINGHNHQYERTDVIKGDTVTKKLPIGGTAYPETEGVVYVTAGAAGRSLYAFSAPDSYEGHEHEVDSVASFVNLKDGKQNETVAWSRVRYLNYSFLRVDVTPAPKGRLATLKVSGIAETGDRIDHFTVARRAK